MKVKSLSRVWLVVTPWTAAHQAPRSRRFSRQECWSDLPLPSPTMNHYSAINRSKLLDFPGGTSGKESTCQCVRCKKRRLDLWVGKIPWRREGQPTPLFLPGKSTGQRSLAGYSPWGHRVRHDWAHTHSHTHKLLTHVTTWMHIKNIWLKEASLSFPKSTYDNVIACIWIIKISQTSL